MRKKPNTRILQHRYEDGKLAIELDVELCVKAAYTKVIILNSTTSGSTGEVVYHMSRLVWYLATRIG
jgi:hypothetical protein